MIYLDNSATTKASPKVIEVMSTIQKENYGNPSSLYTVGRNARDALEESRAIIADFIGAKTEEIIFTGSGTEADNMAIIGTARTQKEKGNHIITSQFEHPAILSTCKSLEKEGFIVTYLKPNKEGIIEIKTIENAITHKTILVSIMHANNEIGTIQPIEKIGKICREKKIIFHTDAVQTLGKEPIDVIKMNLDIASFSAHKIHGPRGIGALYIRRGIKLTPIIHGGGQERGLRPGTENVCGAAGFSQAIKEYNQTDIKKMTELRNHMIKELLTIPHTHLNGSQEKRLCNNTNIRFKSIEGESILLKLDQRGVCVSTGSACSSNSLEPSHVLMALGIKPEEAHGSIRITLSKYTTEEEVKEAAQHIKEVVQELRRMSPL